MSVRNGVVMRLSAGVLGLLVVLSVTSCAGRRVATTFTDMERHVPPGTTVYVTTADGTEAKGKLATLSVSSMTVSLRNTTTRDFSEAEVTRVRVKDPLWNGMLIGAGIGSLSFALGDEGCSAPNASPDCIRVSRGAGIAIGTAMGAALGTVIDALRHRQVFRATRSTRGAALFIAPVVTPNMAAVRVSSRF